MHDIREEGVSVQWEVAAKINFACQQSSYPVLRDIRIENLDRDGSIEDLIVTLRSDPEFVTPKVWTVDRIAAGGAVPLKDRVVDLSGGYLAGLTDSVRGTLILTVEHSGAVILEARKSVEILAHNEWGGAGYMPELLAAFSLPNDPAVDRILHSASQLLRGAGKEDALDGYQSGQRRRVWEVTSALYAAIANLGLSYAVPPASFERDGQKIRLPSKILEGRVTTCLDTTMLFASALEQAGLNPVIALPRGHALIGVWLQPEELSSIVVEDAETLRKLSALNELLLIETTLVTQHPAPPLSRAIQRAKDCLDEEYDTTFSAAVDIRRARAHQIKPLGLKGPEVSTDEDAALPQIEIALEEAPAMPDFDTKVEELLPDTPDGRLERWQRKLLDLSAQNSLLNHKSTKASLALLCPDPGDLEDRLADGQKVTIQPLPEPSGTAQDQEIHTRRTGQIITKEYALAALQKNQVLVGLPSQDLKKRAVEIYRKAQTSLQEGGANTLYLAIGFLSWKRDEQDDRRFRAPLILMPVILHRQSVRSGLKMSAHDDETRFNTTLLEMLRKDFEIDIKGLDEKLPEDQSGVDVAGIWERVRKAVKDAPGFEVVEDVVLGHFSFAKYLMWKDLVERTDDLRSNPVVQHLIDTPRETYHSTVDFVSADRLDRDYSPSDLLAPLPADSSQMAAVATADKGKDFIIIGPPGTGKSQTISNLIAHLLGKAKSVLFVSEKTAALNVVHRRLKDIGLGRFCLELHSNKAKKTEVLSQLANAWEAGGTRSKEEWEKEAQRLKRLRDRLNGVVNYMHTPKRNGLTPHYAIGLRVRDAGLAERIAFSWAHSGQHDAEQLDAMRDAVDRLRVQAKAIGSFEGSPFHIVETGDWSPQWEAELVERAKLLSDATRALSEAASVLLSTLSLSLPDQTISRLEALSSLVDVLMDSYRHQTGFALSSDGSDRIDALEQASTHLERYKKAQSALSVPYEPLAWRQIDGEDIERRWRKAETTWWPKKLFAMSAIRKELQQKGAHEKPEPLQDSLLLTTLRQEGGQIDALDQTLSDLKIWKAHDTDPEKVRSLRELGVRARRAVGLLMDDPMALAEVRGKVRTLIQDGNDLLAPDAAVGRAAEAYREKLTALKNATLLFKERAGTDIRQKFAARDHALDAMREAAETIVERRQELNSWCAWRKRRIEAMDLDLAPLVDGIESGRVPVDEIPDTFEAAYCTWWSSRLFGEDEVLRAWSTVEQKDAIAKFRDLDGRFQKTTAEYIAAVLSGRIPGEAATERNKQWGLVRKLTKQKRPRVPIRKMITDAPEPISKLAPCMMMSPLSVAQYLPSDQAQFDVVIFDEASQLTVWDAVGAIARGRQTIIAGDPKQMPPTNFFNRSDDDPDGDVDYDGDMESILDELQSAGIPEQTLNLHYRSRRESLIAFSNAHYYDNRLVTFPAPIHPDQGVSLRQPDGFYARGKARHNEGEAKAIVAEITRRLTSKDKSDRSATIGVVTFNTDQQTLILDLLDKARGANPEIEWAFAEEAQEPVFVKNLETVQGDERDVILFSVTYGPDQSGHVTMNFGPLNRDGGERRLNVALTRARSEMIVFSTLSPDRIDLSRTNAEAVKNLKHFLEYAERGPNALAAAVHGSVGDFESPFEVAVARSLRERGWQLQPQIGVSAFRIDLGIVHPDEPGIYLAGIECDGAMYHSSSYARERDKIRQQVLEGLGWTLFRVWSTDWWINKQGALDALDMQLKTQLEKVRRDRQAALEENQEALSADTESPSEDDVGEEDKSVVFQEQDDRVMGLAEPTSVYDATPVQPALDDMLEAGPPSQPSLLLGHQEVTPAENEYLIADLPSGRFTPDPDRFYDKNYELRLNLMIDHIVDIEGPIHEGVLIRRIARHHGFQRAGRQIRELLTRLAERRRGKTREDVGTFYWRKSTVKDRITPARLTNRNDDLRKIENISAEELRQIALVLQSREPLEIARALSIKRLSSPARLRLETVLL